MLDLHASIPSRPRFPARATLRETATAHHESGHVVAGIALNWRLDCVSVNSDARRFGYTLWKRTPPPRDVEAWICVLAAGGIAESKYRRTPFRFSASVNDYTRACDIVQDVFGHRDPVRVREYHAGVLRAHDIVAAGWRDIEAIASLLTMHRQVTHLDVINLLKFT